MLAFPLSQSFDARFFYPDDTHLGAIRSRLGGSGPPPSFTLQLKPLVSERVTLQCYFTTSIQGQQTPKKVNKLQNSSINVPIHCFLSTEFFCLFFLVLRELENTYGRPKRLTYFPNFCDFPSRERILDQPLVYARLKLCNFCLKNANILLCQIASENDEKL